MIGKVVKFNDGFCEEVREGVWKTLYAIANPYAGLDNAWIGFNSLEELEEKIPGIKLKLFDTLSEALKDETDRLDRDIAAGGWRGYDPSSGNASDAGGGGGSWSDKGYF